jgi:hypothetical protein
MSYGSSIRLLPETIRSLAFGAIGPAYIGIGTGFNNPIRIIDILNMTNQGLMFSFDGINDHFALPNNGFLLLDVTTNRTTPADAMYIAEGSRIYVRQLGAAPGAGAVYVSAFYGLTD